MSDSWRLSRKRANLSSRNTIIQAIRQFFTERGYLETETPFRIPAPAPEAHIDGVESRNWFLHTSPELCMKRLLAAGYERIFQICRCWRNEERGSRHLPEFTMLEWYRADVDYRFLMHECEELLRSLATCMGRGTSIHFGGKEIRLDGDWEQVSVREAFSRYGGLTMEEALARDQFDLMMTERIEPHLGQTRPTFLYDYPAQLGALARLNRDDPTVAERFELYIGGIELANAFSELNDPDEQRRRFIAEAAFRADQGKTPYPLPEKFLAELATMPEAAGIALGIDRLVMVLLDTTCIDDVVAFAPEDL
jgi:lysyl-tRNA synthetase class 2